MVRYLKLIVSNRGRPVVPTVYEADADAIVGFAFLKLPSMQIRPKTLRLRKLSMRIRLSFWFGVSLLFMCLSIYS